MKIKIVHRINEKGCFELLFMKKIWVPHFINLAFGLVDMWGEMNE